MLFLSVSCFAEFFDAKELTPGLKATGYTVFSSSKGLESFGLEILGQMKNYTGPGQDLIIARVLGERFNHSNVVAGMSGSPVYINGKLLGALSYSFGHFTTEAIAGITPIKNMLGDIQNLPQMGSLANKTVQPIALSLVAGGLSPNVAKYFGAELSARGLGTPVLAAANVGSGPVKSKALYPGAPFAAILVSGDMDLSCIGTVTWMEGSNFVGLGHPFLQNGVSELPITGAEIVTTIFGQEEPYKMGQPTQVMGVLTSDRSSGVTGIIGKKPRVMPLEVQVGPKKWHYNISRMGKDTLLFASMALSNSLAMTPEREQGGTYRLKAEVQILNGSKISYEREVVGQDLPLEPAAIAVFLEPMILLQNQDYQKVEFESMKIQVSHSVEVEATRLVGFRISSQPMPGKSLELVLYHQNWQKKLQEEHVILKMPDWNFSGAYQILALDRASSLALEKESSIWSGISTYSDLLNRINSFPKDTETCFFLKELRTASNSLGYNLTDLPISLKETVKDFTAGSEISFNTKATRLGCVDLRSVVTGKVLKDYGEKRQP